MTSLAIRLTTLFKLSSLPLVIWFTNLKYSSFSVIIGLINSSGGVGVGVGVGKKIVVVVVIYGDVGVGVGQQALQLGQGVVVVVVVVGILAQQGKPTT